MKLRHLVLSSLLAAPALALPPPPELPAAPSKLAKQIASLAKQVQKVTEQCQDTGERNPGEYDARCPSWLARINKAGEAANWALYTKLLGEGPDGPLVLWGASETEDYLYDVMVKHANKDTVVALIRAVHRAAGPDQEDRSSVLERYLDTLQRITGDDALPYKISGDLEGEGAEKAATAWLTWWDANKDKSIAEWRSAGLEKAKQRVASADFDVRWHAARRLMEKDGDLPAAQNAITSAIGSADLPAEHSWTYASLAYTAKLTQAQVEAAQTVRRKALIARGDEDAKNEQAEIDKREMAASLLEQCQRSFYALHLEESRDACAKAVELDDSNILSRIGLGWAEFELGNTDAAEKALEGIEDLVYEGADDVVEKVWQLEAAIHTVAGDLSDAKELLRRDSSEMSQEMRSRLALLEGRAAPATWVAYVAPRYFCWKGKGDEAANAYLLRRGFVKPEAFTTGFAALPSERRRALEENAQDGCPWKAVVSSAAPPRS